MGQSHKWKNHYNDPLEKQPDGLHGNSHHWGDADPRVLTAMVNMIREAAITKGLDKNDIRNLLAQATVESGFNPSAATSDKNSSATGVGQFVDTTRPDYNLPDDKMWNPHYQIPAYIKKYVFDRNWWRGSDKRRPHGDPNSPSEIYRYYHDGYDEKDRNAGVAIKKWLMQAYSAWDEVERFWGNGVQFDGIVKFPVKPGVEGFRLGFSNPDFGDGANFDVLSDGNKLIVSRGGITTTKDLKTGDTTASIPGLGEGFKVAPTGMIHAGDVDVRLPLKSTDTLGGVFKNGQKLADIPYGNSLTGNGNGLIVLDGKKNAPTHMVMPDGTVAQFDYGADGKPSGIHLPNQEGDQRYSVVLQQTPGGGYSVVTTDNQTHATTTDAYGADSRLTTSKTENADHTTRAYQYYDAKTSPLVMVSAQTDFDGERTTTRKYKLAMNLKELRKKNGMNADGLSDRAGANVNALSQVEVTHPGGAREVTTYKIDFNTGVSHPDECVYTNTDKSTSTMKYGSDGSVKQVVARDSRGRMITTVNYGPNGEIKVTHASANPPGRKSTQTRKNHGRHRAGLDDATLADNGDVEDADNLLAGQQKTEAGSEQEPDVRNEALRFNPDGSGRAITTHPDGTQTTEDFNTLEGYIKLADSFDTLPFVVASAPERFALQYMAQQREETNPRGADEPDAQGVQNATPPEIPNSDNAPEIEATGQAEESGMSTPESAAAPENAPADGIDTVAPEELEQETEMA